MHAFVQIFYIIPLDTSVKFYLIDLFLNQKYVVSTQKKSELDATFEHQNKYSKTCLKRPLKISKIKVVETSGSLVQVESIAEGAFSNTCELHQAIFSLEDIF